ncbi:hypothetical protein M752DRAFT_63698 [Aspergillus phoenicis ATCC 13157]|uniref:Uncharacterized protein n=1 Tax=Aspergillus phoenicis ATCC 13157 TaxID=1353007 RepID=A0A370PXZ2_ASPPH|nr:hypothetical protein M752DRAFT_63698 [Aspergillus phoenicis ATCC 13157]
MGEIRAKDEPCGRPRSSIIPYYKTCCHITSSEVQKTRYVNARINRRKKKKNEAEHLPCFPSTLLDLSNLCPPVQSFTSYFAYHASTFATFIHEGRCSWNVLFLFSVICSVTCPLPHGTLGEEDISPPMSSPVHQTSDHLFRCFNRVWYLSGDCHVGEAGCLPSRCRHPTLDKGLREKAPSVVPFVSSLKPGHGSLPCK